MTDTKAQRKAKLLELARKEAQPSIKKVDNTVAVVTKKVPFESFRGMFKHYIQARSWIRDELQLNVEHIDLDPSDENWAALYEMSIAWEAARFTDKTQLNPPARPRKTVAQTILEKEWAREQAKLVIEDNERFTTNGGPRKFGQTY